MACTTQDLADATKCLIYLSRHQLLSAWAYAVCQSAAPVNVTTRITEEGDTRVTEEGDTRIIQ